MRYCLQRLIESWFPAPPSESQNWGSLIYPETPPLQDRPCLLLSDSPLLLAATGLLRTLLGRTPCRCRLGEVFVLNATDLDSSALRAILIDKTGMTRGSKQELAMQLRSAWPNRRFKVATGDPRWYWESLYLLGILSDGRQATLDLPRDLLWLPSAAFWWELIDDRLRLTLIRSTDRQQAIEITTAAGAMELGELAAPHGMRRRLTLALLLPGSVFELLTGDFIWPDATTGEPEDLQTWTLYTESRFYQQLQQMLTTGTPAESPHDAPPYPDAVLLERLKLARADDKGADIDRLLANLCNCPELLDVTAPVALQPSPALMPAQETTANVMDLASAALSAQGLPNFPDQYLYFLDRPTLKHYSLALPIRFENEILGQFDLIDADGQIVRGAGEELKLALSLCAEAGRSDFELPERREDIESLLLGYQKDLAALRQTLKTLCYSHIEKNQAAKKLVQRVWKKFKLPDLKRFPAP